MVWIIVRSRCEFQVGHLNQSTTLTTDHKNTHLFLSYLSLTKIMNRADKYWAHFSNWVWIWYTLCFRYMCGFMTNSQKNSWTVSNLDFSSLLLWIFGILYLAYILIRYLLIGEVIHIRRSDKKNEEVFYAADVTPDFLMGVFELKSPPKFLKSESTGIKMKILQSNLVVNDTYTIEGPGPDIVISRAEGDSNNYGKFYLDLRLICTMTKHFWLESIFRYLVWQLFSDSKLRQPLD